VAVTTPRIVENGLDVMKSVCTSDQCSLSVQFRVDVYI